MKSANRQTKGQKWLHNLDRGNETNRGSAGDLNKKTQLH